MHTNVAPSYYVYKITNLLNGKIYVGKRRHMSPYTDTYMGSGKLILSAIKKYGKSNFLKEIISVFSSDEGAANLEKELVTKEFVSRGDTYNMHEGGFGGFAHCNNGSPEHIARCKAGGRLNGGTKNWTDDSRRRVLLGGVGGQKLGVIAAQSPGAVLKRNHSFKIIKHQRGENNSQFGTIWITDGELTVRAMKDDPIPKGWRGGRTLTTKVSKPVQSARVAVRINKSNMIIERQTFLNHHLAIQVLPTGFKSLNWLHI